MSALKKPDLFSVWEGVYESFEEAGGDFDAFDTDIWIQKQKDKIVKEYASLSKFDETAKSPVAKDYPLPLVVSMLLGQQDTISILDFGGGMGAQYLELIAKVPGALDKVRYVVVDGQRSIENIPDVMKKYSNLTYHSSLEEVEGVVDIVHIGSTLQYIEDWQGILGFLTEKFNPKYFVFSDLLAGDVPTFVAHQIFYDKKIPHLFLNLKEFAGFLSEKLRFSLIYQTKHIHHILDQEVVFPNNALPDQYQIDRAVNLLFVRK